MLYSVNGNRAKTAKSIKRRCHHTDIQAMWWWIIHVPPFYDFCSFWSIAVNIMYKLVFTFIVIGCSSSSSIHICGPENSFKTKSMTVSNHLYMNQFVGDCRASAVSRNKYCIVLLSLAPPRLCTFSPLPAPHLLPNYTGRLGSFMRRAPRRRNANEQLSYTVLTEVAAGGAAGLSELIGPHCDRRIMRRSSRPSDSSLTTIINLAE